MDILAQINSIGLNGVANAYVGYSAIASDGVTSASWGGIVAFQIDATQTQINQLALAQIKADAAVQMGKPVPANARIKVIGN